MARHIERLSRPDCTLFEAISPISFPEKAANLSLRWSTVAAGLRIAHTAHRLPDAIVQWYSFDP
jgi:hypothetical protein